VTELDGWRLAEIARRAGAPLDKSAGIDLQVSSGMSVASGQVLYVIHGSSALDLESAAMLAQIDSGIVLGAPA
jgi:thymidine phosphorylase